ncbi:hypothetical protein [Fibrobacter sp. UWEL]|uniref:hypothetical protein n=1 Tax=Fibrobacter sp. UWEL TaxID=1896209 RepID=UPI000912F1D4|nr:hypothetical protein [Fibrobacter sp. UWEL]SHK56558.1 hypothetical protein SAMN05720468_103139 [Fibrobacter sp. UWEL]
MTRLLLYILPGFLLDVLLLLAHMFLVSEAVQAAGWYNVLLPLIQILAIVIPCVIYYIKMPPGQDTRP